MGLLNNDDRPCLSSLLLILGLLLFASTMEAQATGLMNTLADPQKHFQNLKTKYVFSHYGMSSASKVLLAPFKRLDTPAHLFFKA